MSVERVREALKPFGMDGRIKEFDVSSATVELAAQAVGTEPGRIAKTLSFLTPDGPILILVAGDARIDNKKYKQQFKTKAKMIPADQVLEIVGHDIGGVCPFGINEGVTVYLDDSLKKYETVFPAAGSSNSAVEMNMDELESTSGSIAWINVSK